MDEGLKNATLEWFARGDRDLETAQLLYDEHGYSDVIAYHIQQVVEKYLKGFLILQGHHPPGPPAEFSREELKVDLDLVWQLAREIRGKSGL